MSNDLSIIVVTWNNAREIGACLDSISGARGLLDLETRVVDNASDDRTVAAIREHPGDVILRVNDHNLGFAAACNLAIAEATGRHLLLLNPDARLLPTSLAGLVEHMDAHPEVGIVGPRLVGADGTVQRSCNRFPSLRSTLIGHVGGGGFVPLRRNRASVVDAVSGAALLARGELTTAIGPLDPEYFMYGEDTDWCYRATRAGWQVHYLPTVTVVHLQGASADQVPVATYVRRRVARLRFVRRYRSPWEGRALQRLTRWNLVWRRFRAAGDRRRYYAEVLESFDRELAADG